MGQGVTKYIPKRSIKVLIVDDQADCIQAMLKTLKNWENIEVEYYELKSVQIPDVTGYDIVLLDHYMPVKGRTCARIFREEQGYTGMIASISSVENRFEYAQAWFHQKHYMGTDDSDFILWMNDLLISM